MDLWSGVAERTTSSTTKALWNALTPVSPATSTVSITEASSVSNVGSANAISASPDQASVVVAGRDVLKVFRCRSPEGHVMPLEFALNLRVGKTNMRLSSIDVAWHPMKKSVLATAAANGAVVLWDLEKKGEQKQNRFYSAHARTANSVRFHPTSPALILSGSQDLHVKQWDTRLQQEDPVAAYKLHEAVRQVAWNPHNSYQFAAALENGAVQILDTRTGATVEKVLAHSGPVYTVDWHPTEYGKLASGGRDKVVRIWNVDKTMRNKDSLVCAIKTIASVARVCWRPDEPNQITSWSLMHDQSIVVWDVRRRHVPVLSFQHHKNLVTGAIWDKTGKDYIISCGKDEKLALQPVATAHKPVEDAAHRSFGISWNPHGELAQFSMAPQAKSRTRTISGPSGFFSSMPVSPKPAQANNWTTPSSNLRVLHSPHPNIVKHLAEKYLLRPNEEIQSVTAVCEHNASVCESIDEHQLAQSWRVVGGLWDFQSRRRKTLVSTDTISKVVGETTGASNLEKESTHYKAQLEEFITGPKIFQDNNENEIKFNAELKEDSVLVRKFLSDEDENEDEEDIEESDDDEEDENENIRDTSSFRKREGGKTVSETKTVFAAHITSVEMDWDDLHIISNTIKFHGESGDVQTSVTMMLVLGKNCVKDIPENQQLDWSYTYCELLDKMGLHNERVRVLRGTHLPQIKGLSNHVYNIGCGMCQKTLPKKSGVFCAEKCRKVVGQCSYCRIPVKSLYVWCQGCGHGGHLKCMKEWFSTNKICPTGCGHTCEFS